MRGVMTLCETDLPYREGRVVLQQLTDNTFMNYPPIPSELSVRSIPLTNLPGESCACPWNIPGDTAVKELGKKIVYVADTTCTVTVVAFFPSPQKAWEEAIFTACRILGYEINEASFATEGVQNKARNLIGNMEWWIGIIRT